MYTALLKPVLARIYPCEVEEVKHHKQKEMRIIDTLEPVISGHKLIVAASVIRKDFESTKIAGYASDHAHKYQLFWQLSHITRDRGSLTQDDRLDALAMAVGYWVEQMNQDADRNTLVRKEEELLAELATFQGAARGVSTTDRKVLSDLAKNGELEYDQTIIQLGLQQSYVVGLGMVDYASSGNGAGTWVSLP